MRGLILRRVGLPLVLLAALSSSSEAQRYRGGQQVKYDGKFMLARLVYRGFSGWSFDFPHMDHHLPTILEAISAVRPGQDVCELLRRDYGGDPCTWRSFEPVPNTFNTFTMDNPDLLKFPVAYLSEPGYWFPTASEAVALRRYLEKGGFLIVDDFHFENEWAVFEQAIRLVLPKAKIERLGLSHPIFHAFFDIKSLEVPYPGTFGDRLLAEFYGIYREDAPSRSLMVVINYNADMGDYVEHSSENRYAVAPSNEAYKFFINYVIYGLSH